MLTSGRRYKIGKQAAEHGVTATLPYYSEKYWDLPLSETSVRRFKGVYKHHCRLQAIPRPASEDSDNADLSAGTSENAHVELKNYHIINKDNHSFYLMHWIPKCKSMLKIYKNMGCRLMHHYLLQLENELS